MFVAWTTTAKRADADRLACGAVESRLVACAQVDGPVASYYHWEGKLESTEEYRIWFKYLPANASASAPGCTTTILMPHLNGSR